MTDYAARANQPVVHFPITHEPLRSFPVPEINGLGDFPSVEDSLDPDGTRAALVLAGRESAFPRDADDRS